MQGKPAHARLPSFHPREDDRSLAIRYVYNGLERSASKFMTKKGTSSVIGHQPPKDSVVVEGRTKGILSTPQIVSLACDALGKIITVSESSII